MPEWFFIIAMGLFGLLFGSFANVVIWRLPRGESIASPGSHCPSCDTPIAWHDNVPVLSWLALRAKCRRCGARIPARYPAVEIASGIAFASAAWRFGVGLQAVAAALFLWGLLALSLIDIAHFRLPNPLVGALAVFGAVAAVASQLTGAPIVPLVGVTETGLLSHPVLAGLAGALAAGGTAFAVAEGYALVRKREGLGMGDVKLLGVLGLFLGLYGFMALALASMLGVLVVIALSRTSEVPLGQTRIPFGALLAAGATIVVFAGPQLWGWYLGLVGLA